MPKRPADLKSTYGDSQISAILSSASKNCLARRTMADRGKIENELKSMMHHFSRALNKIARLDPVSAEAYASEIIRQTNATTAVL